MPYHFPWYLTNLWYLLPGLCSLGEWRTWYTGVSPLLSKMGGSCGGDCDCGCRCTLVGIVIILWPRRSQCWTWWSLLRPIVHQDALNVKLGDLYWGLLLFRKHCFLEKISRIMWMKRSFWWQIIHDRCSKSTAFLTIFDQEALNGEDTSSKSIFEKSFVVFWKDFKNYWTKTSFLWHISTRSLFKKHCFLDKIWPRGSSRWKYEKAFFRKEFLRRKKRFQELLNENIFLVAY